MKKTLLISALLLLFLSEAFPQVEIASPEMLVCPGESISYGAFPASVAGCSYKWTVTNGMFSNGSTTIEGYNLLDVTVIWNNVQATSNTSAPKGTLHVEVYGCALPTGESNNDSRNDIVIKTLNNVTPSAITGSANVGIYAGSVSYSIPKVVFPNTGTTNGWSSTIYADSYQWVIPLGWELDGMFSDGSTPITNQGNSVAVTPNDCGGNGSKIKVRAYSSCGPGYTSKWQELTISRTLPALSFSQAPPNFIVCGDTNPVTVSVAPVAGATSYTWTKPSGWSGSSTSNSITLTPNGTTGGTISVKANVCGTQTPALSKVIDMELHNPINQPMVLGPPSLCSSGASYSLYNVPTGATITWNSSPNIALVSPQGSNPATFKATAASSGINSFISANISTPCGAMIKKKSSIYTSTGYISNPTIVGSSVVCTGGTWTAQIPAGADAIMWEFDQNNMTLLSGGLNTQSITLQFKPGATGGWVSVKSHSACGWTPSPNYLGIAKSCSYYSYTISPNPSSSRITISKAPVAVDGLAINKSTITNTPNVYAEIYTLTNSELLKSFALEGEETIVDIQDLGKGTYVLRILENNEVIVTERLIFN